MVAKEYFARKYLQTLAFVLPFLMQSVILDRKEKTNEILIF